LILKNPVNPVYLRVILPANVHVAPVANDDKEERKEAAASLRSFCAG
jgi:hypothetical protein